jgi:hypothetical protein
VIRLKNTINYYYNIIIDNFIKTDNDYYFYLNNEEYHLIIFNRPYEDIEPIYNLNMQMKKRGCLVHEIILNKDKQAVTIVNDNPYVLIKLCKYKNDRVFLNDINYIQNMTKNIQSDKSLLRVNWVKMWTQKIDYYEYQISQLGKKYPILCDSLSYFIGLGENAISYIINNQIQDDNSYPVVSHKRIRVTDGSIDFYNPLNFVVDSRVRDIAEYIKNCFYNNTFNFYEIKSFFQISNFSKNEFILLFSRLLFPTFYFDMYDEIINNNYSEEKILDIIDKTYEYEELLFSIYKFIVYEKKVQIEPIEWIIKEHSN